MKRLFQLMMPGDNRAYAYMADKVTAKMNACNGAYVSIGPDHWRYGWKNNQKTHSHNSRSGGHGNGFPKKACRFS